MSNEDAFITIEGRLKIFDFIKLDEALINKIEFVDLPGHDHKNNVFVGERYYDKILKFSNCCIYINDPDSIEDKTSVHRIQVQYKDDKSKLFPTLQPKFINSCLFLVNKSDKVPEKETKEKIKNSLIKTISTIDENASSNNINISFYSGKCFTEFLDYYKIYVELLENNPFLCLEYLYKEWSSDRWHLLNFKTYVVDKIVERIEERLDLSLNLDLNIPSEFTNKLKFAFSQLFNKYKPIKNTEVEQIIKTLYYINYSIKNTDFSDSNYSRQFFETLKKVIINSENLQKENLNRNFEAFFRNADTLFNREIIKESAIQKEQSKEKYNLIKFSIIPETKKILLDKKNKIKEIISDSKNKCLNLVSKDINYHVEILEAEKYDIEKAFTNLESKIKFEIDDMQQKQENETKTIIDDIKKKSREIINTYYKSKDLPLEEYEKLTNEVLNFFENLLVNAIKDLSYRVGLGGVVLAIGGIVGGVVGLGIGGLLTMKLSLFFGALGLVGGVILGGLSLILGYFYVKNVKKEKYRKDLEKLRDDLERKFNDVEYNFSEHYRTFTDSLINELNLKVDVLHKKVEGIDVDEWNKIREEYKVKKEEMKKKMEEKLKRIKLRKNNKFYINYKL